MRRANLINLIRLAGAEGDQKTLIRLMTENRNISYKAAMEAYRQGQQMVMKEEFVGGFWCKK